MCAQICLVEDVVLVRELWVIRVGVFYFYSYKMYLDLNSVHMCLCVCVLFILWEEAMSCLCSGIRLKICLCSGLQLNFLFSRVKR